MAIEEYFVVMGDEEKVAHTTPIVWNGAVAGAEIAEPKALKPIKNATVVIVQAESAAEAIKGAKQSLPGYQSGTTYGILKSSLTTG